MSNSKSIVDTTKSDADATASIPPTSPLPSNLLPVVEFEYPDSESSKMKVRYLRVTEANADYIKGYELDSPGSKKDGQFKTFLRNRLVRNGVSLISFNLK